MKIAVLTRKPESYSVKRLIEEGVKGGHEIITVDPLECYVEIAKGEPRLFHPQLELDNIEAIIPRISVEATFYGASIVRQFETMEVFTTAPSQAITRTRDKLRSLQIMAKKGVDMPKTTFACNPQEVDKVIDRVGGAPLVVKLLEGTQGVGVMLADTNKSAKSIIECFYGVKVNILVQEFIAESAGTDIRVFIVDNKVVGSMKRQGAEGDFRSNIHRGGSGEKIKLSKEEKATALKAVKSLGLRIAGVDLLQSNRGPLVMEVNSSPGLEGIEKATGKNIAERIIKYIEDHRPKRTKKDKVGL